MSLSHSFFIPVDCGISSTGRAPASQAGEAGSSPVSRLIFWFPDKFRNSKNES